MAPTDLDIHFSKECCENFINFEQIVENIHLSVFPQERGRGGKGGSKARLHPAIRQLK